MALDYANKKLDKYFDALFVMGNFGNPDNELFALHDVLPTEDFFELKNFGSEYKKMLHFVSRDEEEGALPQEVAELNKFEKLLDEINIAPRYKVKVYDVILNGLDKFDRDNEHSLRLLSKMVDNTPLKDGDNLRLIQEISRRYRYGNYDAYDALEKKIKLKISGKDPKKIELAKQRFIAIGEELKNRPADEKRIALLKEQFELADKCGFKRLQKFQTKANISYNLANLYAGQRDIYNHDYYAKESVYYTQLVKNIYNHLGK